MLAAQRAAVMLSLHYNLADGIRQCFCRAHRRKNIAPSVLLPLGGLHGDGAFQALFLHLALHFIGLEQVAVEGVGVGRAPAGAVEPRPAGGALLLVQHVGGGELPAAIIADAVVRLLPGAISDETSALSDCYQDGLLSPPVYTRPAEFNGWKVPDVLLSGNPRLIRQWQDEQAVERTRKLRPGLLEE